eukprot:TRINITY_DN9146_c0_g1_i1.p1 TRINITY_DN9146_c0_g1~~TRINITY_DN9146_c0_g1_i1.p1  ORF type:complete len:117 (+),score=8.25 TRINITY_DN9146_c0_g1_i1:64-414(+)
MYVKFILSGSAPEYPVTVEYNVSINGVAVIQETLDILSGVIGVSSIEIPESVGIDDNLEVEILGAQHAYVGSSNITYVDVIDVNLAPRLDLVLQQNNVRVNAIDTGVSYAVATASY